MVFTSQVTFMAAWKYVKHPLVQVAKTVKLKIPVTFGVPDKVPVGDKEIPTGRFPAVTEKVKGGIPP